MNHGGRAGRQKGIWKHWPKSPSRSDSLNAITAKEFYYLWYLLPVTWHNVIPKKHAVPTHRSYCLNEEIKKTSRKRWRKAT